MDLGLVEFGTPKDFLYRVQGAKKKVSIQFFKWGMDDKVDSFTKHINQSQYWPGCWKREYA